MRRARQRQVLPCEPEALDDPVLDQRHRLERLGGGAPEGPVIRIACGRHEATVAVYNRNVDGVAGFDDGTTVTLDVHRAEQ